MLIDRQKAEAILQNHPDLGAYGFQDGKGRHGSLPNEPFDRYAVAACLEFMSLCGKIKTADKCSYSIKHRVEYWLRLTCHEDEIGRQYIGSGVPIFCAIYLGFPWRKNGSNADIGVSAKIDRYEKLPPFSGSWLDRDAPPLLRA